MKRGERIENKEKGKQYSQLQVLETWPHWLKNVRLLKKWFLGKPSFTETASHLDQSPSTLLLWVASSSLFFILSQGWMHFFKFLLPSSAQHLSAAPMLGPVAYFCPAQSSSNYLLVLLKQVNHSFFHNMSFPLFCQDVSSTNLLQLCLNFLLALTWPLHICSFQRKASLIPCFFPLLHPFTLSLTIYLIVQLYNTFVLLLLVKI